MPENGVHAFQIISNFNYQAHAAFYYSGNFPLPGEQGREQQIIQKLKPLINNLKGGYFDAYHFQTGHEEHGCCHGADALHT